MKAARTLAAGILVTVLAVFGVLGVLAVFAPGGVAAQDVEVPPAALSRLQHHVGDWEIKTEYVDLEGNIVSTAHGTEIVRWAIAGIAVEMTTRVPKLDYLGKGWMFYNASDDRFYVTSVDSRGEFWILSGGVDEDVITSEPKLQPDGREMTIRFTHKNVEADSFEAVMEYSFDDGKNWQIGFLQTVTRQIAGG